MREIIAGLLVATVLPSCVRYTKIESEAPTPKRFQNGEAAQIFYESELMIHEEIAEENDQNLTLSVALQSPVWWSRRVTDQKRVNDAFRKADLDGNGYLTLVEARQFAKSEE